MATIEGAVNLQLYLTEVVLLKSVFTEVVIDKITRHITTIYQETQYAKKKLNILRCFILTTLISVSRCTHSILVTAQSNQSMRRY